MILFSFFFCPACLFAQGALTKGWKKEVRDFRQHLEWEYLHEERSPLTEADKANFHGLDYFKPHPDFRVMASLQLTPDEQPFAMMTSSGATRQYRKFGYLDFEIRGKALRLAVYQNMKLLQDSLYHDHLFLPFKDQTCGAESYGGGRYVDLKIPEGSKVLLDFNQCYNPYCAYSTGWNCPIVPDENHLDIRIEAGVKKWHD